MHLLASMREVSRREARLLSSCYVHCKGWHNNIKNVLLRQCCDFISLIATLHIPSVSGRQPNPANLQLLPNGISRAWEYSRDHPFVDSPKMVFSLFDSFFAKIKANDKLHLAWCVTGIIGCLVVYGVLQVR